LVQAGKLATLGELTTGVAHELNNPLNNIGLFVGNAMDYIELGVVDANPGQILHDLYSAVQQVRKATEIISHLLTNARDALASMPRKVITIACVVKVDVVELQVEDSGPGIPVGLEQRIFDAFFTTKEVGAGVWARRSRLRGLQILALWRSPSNRFLHQACKQDKLS
jgi:C4-dicarboxylate-specific signal transduction histidine kinase